MSPRDISYAEAIAEALDEILTENDRVFLINAGYSGSGRAKAALDAIREKYGARIHYAPIAELAYCGIAIGAAMVGMRPIVDMGTASFSYEAIPQIVNEAAIIHSNSAGKVSAPVVFHLVYGLRGSGAAQHSASPQSWYWNAPGLQVAMPGSPADAKGLLRWAALRSGSPTVFMDHSQLQGITGPVPEGVLEIPFGQADVKRPGRDATIIACGIQVPRALQAAEILAREDNLDVEVVDPRTLQPLDLPTLLASVRKTGRVVITDESPDYCGVAAGLAGLIADEGFASLKAPIKRVSVVPVPVPYAAGQEDFIRPRVDRIVAAVREVARA